jgi:hypothetical protein
MSGGRKQVIGETGGRAEYADRWGVWREYRDGKVVRGDWLGYEGHVRVFDTQAEAARVCAKLGSGPNTVGNRHLRFFAAAIPALAYERIVAGTYRPDETPACTLTADPADDADEDRRDAQMEAWDAEQDRRRRSGDQRDRDGAA